MRPITDDPPGLDIAARSIRNVMVTAGNGPDRAACAQVIHERTPHPVGPLMAVYDDAPRMVRSGVPVGAAQIESLFQQAAGGTLFVDRIGELVPYAQERLLSLLTEQSRWVSGMPDALPIPSSASCAALIVHSSRMSRPERSATRSLTD
jgi:DNA-binding NtrC family response regulator